MVETIIDVAIGSLKSVLLIIGRILYKIVAAIPDLFLWIIFLFLLFLAYIILKWFWKNKEEWKSRIF